MSQSERDRQNYDWGLASFLDEAKTLAKFKHPNIVGVRDYRAMHGTAYMVMDYEAGQTLSEWLTGQRSAPDEETLKMLFLPILDGLRAVHGADFLHRDIKPDNIYIRADGNPMLIDFGAARQALGEKSKSLSMIFTPGYAVLEQYSLRGNQGPLTDIYGIGASLYRAISGRAPAEANDRATAQIEGDPDPLIPAEARGKEDYSAGFLAAIDHALGFRPKDRPQTVRDFQRALLGETDKPRRSARIIDNLESRAAPTPEPAPQQQTRRLSYEPEMVFIRGGQFLMGSPENEADREDNERLHRVTVSDYWLGKYPVTVGEFRAFIDATGYRTEADKARDSKTEKGFFGKLFASEEESDVEMESTWRDSQYDDHPVVCMSWWDAVAYAAWLSEKTGKRYRLPTEAEWEYAARAGTSTRYWWGDGDPVCQKGARNGAKFDDDAGCNWTGTEPVGFSSANPWGLYDVHGNVYEWTCSKYVKGYDGSEKECSSKNDTSSSRVLRGGSWLSDPRYLRSANRNGDAPGDRGDGLGFRLAQDRSL